MMAADAGGSQPVAPSKLPLCFLGLPPETQHEIVSHCSQSDLVCLALVNKRCRELASAQLYRNFHIVFPDEDDVSFDSPIDGLAGGLDTFTTSDYNYAQHLRDLSMDTLSAGVKAEQSYQPYLYNVSCGKFLNSLLHQTLGKTQSLETFRWNIRVELSRPVYRQLHRIPSLTRLHVRMQSGASYYSPLPPLPSASADMSVTSPQPPQPHPPVSPLPPSKSAPAAKAERYSPGHVKSPTFSGFKGLRSLSVLDIESLDVVREIRTCIRNSFSTLKELQLSLSSSYAQRARTPSPDSEADDSDVDDEFQIALTSHSSSYDASDAAQAFRAQEERKIQDAILGKMFDIEPMLVKRSHINRRLNAELTGGAEAKLSSPENAGENFISSIKAVSAKLMALQQGSRNFSASHQDMLHTIERAAKLFVDSCDLSKQKTAAGTSSERATTQKEGPDGSSELRAANQEVSVDGSVSDDDVKVTGVSPSDKACGDAGASGSSRAVNPGAMDIAGVDGDVVDDVNENSLTSPSGAEQAHDSQGRLEAAGASAPAVSVADSKLTGIVMDGPRPTAADGRHPDEQRWHEKSRETMERSMEAYVRDTRGLSLESLSIHLVPVKASVLSRGVDMCCLKQLTLLNVGNQTPIWSMLAKEGRTQPLALRSVFTDHVTTAFLSCMAQLPELHDLLLLGRNGKHKPESFAPRTTTTMDQIRRLVLRKHMATLKRLMIKDQSSESNWDANEKAMALICSRGVKLEELALSMNMMALHAFMQYLPGLVSLRAFSILRFKNGDTCMGVIREILRFIVDNLSHHPQLKLEWIAIEDDHVDRVVRPSKAGDEVAEAQPTKRAKAKGPVDGTYPPLPADGLESQSESDDDDERCDGRTRLRFETVGPLQFYDVWGVKIFEKEVRSGRL
ncbi:hypothetical protein XA68_12903 [Ophiocordyceps unilateralis]|uniref:F-box domain-containing protein n=1 Tax=Ophiocordyceps unilateralis TaxID=268505 RepID=A0A2A9PDQ0_OPHUN|nr:hypothetical protein XA68_12903 [Ophiocordyceps unilateralis]